MKTRLIMSRGTFYFFLVLLFCFSSVFSKTVVDVISENKNLSSFNSYLQQSGVDNILKKKLPWNWTIFAPSNNAFKNASPKLKKEILNNNFFIKNILMDHIMAGHQTSLDVDENISTQITVSNKPLEIYKRKKLYVKDMVVIEENLIGNNGVVHIIDCIMFVQPSDEDPRVSEDLEEKFPITSCCMRDSDEIDSFKKNAKIKY